jgi:hypothetical protein
MSEGLQTLYAGPAAYMVAGMSEVDRSWPGRFAHAWITDQHDVGPLPQEGEIEQVQDTVLGLHAAFVMVEVKGVDAGLNLQAGTLETTLNVTMLPRVQFQVGEPFQGSGDAETARDTQRCRHSSRICTRTTPGDLHARNESCGAQAALRLCQNGERFQDDSVLKARQCSLAATQHEVAITGMAVRASEYEFGTAVRRPT